MGKVTRGKTAEACLSRLFDGWVPAWAQREWIRQTPNTTAPIRWKSEPMTDQEHALLGEYR